MNTKIKLNLNNSQKFVSLGNPNTRPVANFESSYLESLSWAWSFEPLLPNVARITFNCIPMTSQATHIYPLSQVTELLAKNEL